MLAVCMESLHAHFIIKYTGDMKTSKSGFTIVEMIVVIVIIALLATITIISYNSYSKRARNAQTTSAVASWYKALRMHKARNGTYPTTSGCLGSNYNWGRAGNPTKGSEIAQCRQTSSTAGVVDNQATGGFDISMSPYITGSPTPAMITAGTSATSWSRGAFYLATNPARIGYVLEGTAESCSGQDGWTLASSTAVAGNMICEYDIGPLSGY